MSHSQLKQNSLCLHAIISTGCPLQDSLFTFRQNVLRSLEIFSTRPRSCGGAGWTRVAVAYLNMSDPQQTCPSNWTLNVVRGCGVDLTLKFCFLLPQLPIHLLHYIGSKADDRNEL